jgi:predicted nucleic acid-binding protein
VIWVLDASVAVKWFFTDEILRDKAIEVRARLAMRPTEFVVPHLFHSEILQVLARKSGREAGFVSTALGLVQRLGLRTLALSENGWNHAAHWCALGMSGYDATYLALAQELGGRWLTADEVASAKAGASAMSLGAWNLAP